MATVFMAVAMLLSFFVGCTGDKQVGDAITERDSMAVMRTLGVNTYLTDSGITRLRMEAEEWLVYDRKNPPYQAFEKGMYIEQYDTLQNIISTIQADTVYFFDKQKLWKAMGNVKVDRQGQKIFSSVLYWDEGKKIIYSDQRTHIITPTQDVWVNSFTANQDFTDIRAKSMSGDFDIEESKPDTIQQNSLPKDSVQ